MCLKTKGIVNDGVIVVYSVVSNVGKMSAKCKQNARMSNILKKLHHFATFCLTQTQNLPVQPKSGGELQTNPPSQR